MPVFWALNFLRKQEMVSKKYRKLWILLREKLTQIENNECDPDDKEVYHIVLTEMAQMEAGEFLED